MDCGGRSVPPVSTWILLFLILSSLQYAYSTKEENVAGGDSLFAPENSDACSADSTVEPKCNKEDYLVNDPPSMRLLLFFPRRNKQKTMDISRKILSYDRFGCLMLPCEMGERIQHYLFAYKDYEDTIVQVVRKVLREWLKGEGIQPITWNTLIWALNTMDLEPLANDIKESCNPEVLDMPHKPGQQYNYVLKFADEMRKEYSQSQTIKQYKNLKLPFVMLKVNGTRFDELIRGFEPGSRVLFVGRPGVGKSTLAIHTAKMWAEQELLTHCELTLLVWLSSEVKYEELDQLLRKTIGKHSSIYKKAELVAEEIIASEGHGICFIFDAFDEYLSDVTDVTDSKDDLVLSIVMGKSKLTNSTMFITSRVTETLHALSNGDPSPFSHQYDITGFDSNDLEDYLNDPKLSPTLKSTIKTIFDRNINIKQMCYIPLHMAMVLRVASEPDLEEERLSIIDTETMLYNEFLIQTLQEYEVQHGTEWETDTIKGCLTKQDETSKECTMLLKLCSQAFNTLVTNKKLSSKDFTKDERVLIEKFGLLGVNIKPQGQKKKRREYTFAHKTFKEFLAAMHVVAQFSEEEVILTISNERWSFSPESIHYLSKVVWIFYFGILGRYNIKVTPQRMIDHFIDFSSKHSTDDCTMQTWSRLQRTNKDLIAFAFEAKITHKLKEFMDEENLMTGPYCDDYTLSYPIETTEDCLYLAYVLTWVPVRMLFIQDSYSHSISSLKRIEDCRKIFEKQMNARNPISSNHLEEVTIEGLHFQAGIKAPKLTKVRYSCKQDSVDPEKPTYLALEQFTSKLKNLTIDCVVNTHLIKDLSTALRRMKNLESLTVTLQLDLYEEIDAFARGLRQVTTLKELKITWVNTTFPDNTTSLMFDSFKQLYHLSSLSVDCGCEKAEDCGCAYIIVQSLPKLPALRELEIEKLNTSTELMKSLPNHLTFMHLTHLKIISCVFDPETAQTIFQGLRVLQSFSFIGQCPLLIDERGFEADPDLSINFLSEAVQRLTLLRHLEISSTCIDRKEANSLKQALASSNTLMSVQLSGNIIGRKSYKHIVRQIEKMEQLTALAIKHNHHNFPLPDAKISSLVSRLFTKEKKKELDNRLKMLVDLFTSPFRQLSDQGSSEVAPGFQVLMIDFAKAINQTVDTMVFVTSNLPKQKEVQQFIRDFITELSTISIDGDEGDTFREAVNQFLDILFNLNQDNLPPLPTMMQYSHNFMEAISTVFLQHYPLNLVNLSNLRHLTISLSHIVNEGGMIKRKRLISLRSLETLKVAMDLINPKLMINILEMQRKVRKIVKKDVAVSWCGILDDC